MSKRVTKSRSISTRRQTEQQTKMKPSYRQAYDYSDDDDTERPQRELMRPWLIRQIEESKIEGLRYTDRSKTVVEIPWTHGSRQGFNDKKDACLFELWAKHSGKFREGQTRNAKRWKANFRCAMNSLNDVEEVKNLTVSKGHNARKVYRFLASKKSRRDPSRVRDLGDEAYRQYATNADRQERLRQETLRRLKAKAQNNLKQRSLSDSLRSLMDGSDYGSGYDDSESSVSDAYRSHPSSPSSAIASSEGYVSGYDEHTYATSSSPEPSSGDSTSSAAELYCSQVQTSAAIPSVVEDIQCRDSAALTATEIRLPQSLPPPQDGSTVCDNDVINQNIRFFQHQDSYGAAITEMANNDMPVDQYSYYSDDSDSILQSSSASSVFSSTQPETSLSELLLNETCEVSGYPSYHIPETSSSVIYDNGNAAACYINNNSFSQSTPFTSESAESKSRDLNFMQF